MQKLLFRCFVILICCFAHIHGHAQAAVTEADWPTYRNNLQRSGITSQKIDFPLAPAWTHRPAQPPRSAWPPQPALLNRVDFDYAPQLIAGAGTVFFGSSADDTLYALNLADGSVKWRFTAGGPIRFAPQLDAGRIYFAADDGMVYCLAAADGELLWQFQAAPWPDMMVGNGRVISRWPCRTGVLVRDGTVYTSAGFWQSDGIYVYALDAETGSQKWVNDTGGYVGGGFFRDTAGQHQGEFQFTFLAPQGPLLADGNTLVLPQGHMNPARINMQTGEILGLEEGGDAARERIRERLEENVKKGAVPHSPEVIARLGRSAAELSTGYPGSGGTWCTIDNNRLYVLAMHRSRTVYLNSWDIVSGKYFRMHRSDLRLPQLGGGLNRSVLPGRISVIIRDREVISRNAFDLVLTENALLAGEQDALVALAPGTDQELWRGACNGQARSIAVVNGRVLVSTDQGEIICFAPSSAQTPETLNPAVAETTPETAAPVLTEAENTVLTIFKKNDALRGFALLVGATDTRRARVLAANTELQILLLGQDFELVQNLRQEILDSTNLYGSRIHVLHAPDPENLPLTQYLANAVIVCGSAPGSSKPAELYRVLRPYGGVLLAPDMSAAGVRKLINSSGAPEEEIVQLKNMPAIVRSRLEGANDFDNPVPDPLVKWPLQVLWYGGPDPQYLVNAPNNEMFAGPPTTAYGRYVTRGETELTVNDAFNGTMLWKRPAPRVNTHLRYFNGYLRNVVDVEPIKLPEMHWRIRFRSRLGATREHVYLDLGPAFFHGLGGGIIQLDMRDGRQTRMIAPYIPGPALSLQQPATWVLPITKNKREENAAAPKIPENIAPDLGLDDLVLADAPGLLSLEPEIPAKPQDITRRWRMLKAASPAAARQRLDNQGGILTLRATETALLLEFETVDSQVTELDAWEFFFDFRAFNERYGLYGPGTFSVFLPVLYDPEQEPEPGGRGFPRPRLEIETRKTAKGTAGKLVLTWDELEKLTGSRPLSFGFATTLNSFNAAPEDLEAPVRQRHLFCDSRADGFNVGWANVYLGSVSADAEKMVPAVVAPFAAGEEPPDWGHNGARSPKSIAPQVQNSPRLHPLTLEPGPKIYRSGTWACGGPSFSKTCVFRRPGKPAVGVYDFADDSGLRFIGGVSSPCGTSSIAALGLLLFNDSRFRCDCNPPIKTSFALAPAERRYHEDWAIFFEHEPTSRIRRALINLGAVGDRRDAERRLWLGFPRDFDRAYGYALVPAERKAEDIPGTYLRHVPAGLLVPMTLDFADNGGPYRHNSDRIQILGTERPWLYASGIEGIRRAVMNLDFLTPLSAGTIQDEITADGKLTESAWQTEPDTVLPESGLKIFLRHDRDNLYVAATRPAMIDRRGKAYPWSETTSGSNAPVWNDDSLELFFSDQQNRTVVHLGLAASGAVFEAIAKDDAAESADWSMSWRHGAVADAKELTFEFIIPLSELGKTGLDHDKLMINLLLNQSDTRADQHRFRGIGEGRNWNLKNPTSEAYGSLGGQGRRRAANFAPLGLGKVPEWPRRRFNLKLHFAELDESVKPGERVFDVLLAGTPVLTDVDVVKAAAGTRRALVLELDNIELKNRLELEFRPAPGSGLERLPLVSAVELEEVGN